MVKRILVEQFMWCASVLQINVPFMSQAHQNVCITMSAVPQRDSVGHSKVFPLMLPLPARFLQVFIWNDFFRVCLQVVYTHTHTHTHTHTRRIRYYANDLPTFDSLLLWVFPQLMGGVEPSLRWPHGKATALSDPLALERFSQLRAPSDRPHRGLLSSLCSLSKLVFQSLGLIQRRELGSPSSL